MTEPTPTADLFTSRREALSAAIVDKRRLWSVTVGEQTVYVLANTAHQFKLALAEHLLGGNHRPLTREQVHRLLSEELSAKEDA